MSAGVGATCCRGSKVLDDPGEKKLPTVCAIVCPCSLLPRGATKMTVNSKMSRQLTSAPIQRIGRRRGGCGGNAVDGEVRAFGAGMCVSDLVVVVPPDGASFFVVRGVFAGSDSVVACTLAGS